MGPPETGAVGAAAVRFTLAARPFSGSGRAAVWRSGRSGCTRSGRSCGSGGFRCGHAACAPTASWRSRHLNLRRPALGGLHAAPVRHCACRPSHLTSASMAPVRYALRHRHRPALFERCRVCVVKRLGQDLEARARPAPHAAPASRLITPVSGPIQRLVQLDQAQPRLGQGSAAPRGRFRGRRGHRW